VKKLWKSSQREPRHAYPRILIHEGVFPQTVRILQLSRDERSEHEGIVYWAGKMSPSAWIVTTSIAPRAETTWGSFTTSAASNAEVITFLAQHGLELLAQIHSHPGSRVAHSEGDDEGAFMPYENYLSIRCPQFCYAGNVAAYELRSPSVQ
jgi:hypothetical protein